MSKSDVHPVHIFEPWQVWPGSYDNPVASGDYPLAPSCLPTLNKSTPITSMGSCFAREIKNVLLRQGFNYINEEPDHPSSKHAGAAWERSYNTFSMRQIFEYTFDDFSPEVRWWRSPKSDRIQDPFRRIILYDSIMEAENDFSHHVECSRRALTKARVIIITLGLTEIWESKSDGSVICLPSGPYVNEGGDMTDYRFRVSRFDENLANLERIYSLLSHFNPDADLIVTVSPVHLWATFRHDLDVISASCNSKSTLRAVANEFVARHDKVHYFPAYEMATIYRPMLGQSIFSDGKENFHVNQEVVDFIMNQFFRVVAPQSGQFNLPD